MMKKIPKIGSNHTCFAVISLESALKKYENYYWEVFLKECQYIEWKVVRHSNVILNNSSYSEKSGCQVKNFLR